MASKSRQDLTIPGAYMDGVMDRIYYALIEAAKRGDPCPSNQAMANRLGVRLGAIERAFGALETQGWITIERPNRNMRIVTVEGLTTARPVYSSCGSVMSIGVEGASERQGSEALLRAIARYHVRQGRREWEALAA